MTKGRTLVGMLVAAFFAVGACNGHVSGTAGGSETNCPRGRACRRVLDSAADSHTAAG